jgi:hypothetical protein
MRILVFRRQTALAGTLSVFILYIHRLPQRSSSDSAVTGPVGIHYDSISDTTLKQGGQSDHTVSVWQARELQQDSNRTVNHQLDWYSRLILNKPRLYRLWSMHACRCPNNGHRSIAPRPRPLYWWTHSLKIKYLLVIFSGRQRTAR